MNGTAFDALAYFEKLKAAGVPEEQAKVQANAFRDFSEIQSEKNKQDSASKDDIQLTRLEIEKVRAEIEKVCAGIKSAEIRLLKWQLGIAVALAAIMARGFGWIGF